jgi:hypothetical protein
MDTVGLPVSELLIVTLIGGFLVVPFWRIFTKAGFPGALSFLMIFPMLNLIMLFYLAFAEWPSLRNRG